MKLKDKRIFIVEDNLTNRAVMQLLLEQAGAKTAFERWGKNTINELRQFSPVDVILMDLMLPDNVTGYDLFDQIHSLPEFSNVPIVAVSAADAEPAIRKTHAKGFKGFISKPIRFNMFVDQIVSILEGDEVWHAG